MRVLFVEDSQILLRTVRRALRHAGFAVDTAADGEEGLAAAELNDYDVLVLDIMLPKLDGLALLRLLRGAGNTTYACWEILSNRTTSRLRWRPNGL
jgi:two-component system OmpR family response regulator